VSYAPQIVRWTVAALDPSATLASEASGRRAVLLENQRDFAEFTLSAPANALMVRYAVPDGPQGKPVDASNYCYSGRYPFTNNPADGNGIEIRHNTAVAPILANGVAIYGGHDISVSDNLVSDTLTEGGGLHLGNRFRAVPLKRNKSVSFRYALFRFARRRTP
jgi:hypothetical protein